ncbi:MAG TPA: glycine zipper 2TM domain-containing protein [Burkholderiales bacterium]|nr:glycine zipper 2TM domain-containing protein [Burkholderiales bacterium]
MKKQLLMTATVAIVAGLTACSGMTPRERDTAIGAAVGGVAGSALSGGSALGTVGGAAVGGVIGNQAGKR